MKKAILFLILAVWSPIANAQFHSADVDMNWMINLSEIMRVVQFFNMQGYYCDVTGSTADGFKPGPGADHDCPHHNSDYQDPFWIISISELLRLVQFFNVLGYHQGSSVSDDGFEAGYPGQPLIIVTDLTAETLVKAGNSVTLEIQAAGSGSLSYQWYEVCDGTESPIADATDRILTYTPAEDKEIFCRVTDTVESKNVSLDIIP